MHNYYYMNKNFQLTLITIKLKLTHHTRALKHFLNRKDVSWWALTEQ